MTGLQHRLLILHYVVLIICDYNYKTHGKSIENRPSPKMVTYALFVHYYCLH